MESEGLVAGICVDMVVFWVAVEAPKSAGGVEEAEPLAGVDEALESGGVVVVVGSLTTDRAVTGGVGWGTAGAVSRIGNVVPSETVSCSAGLAKECQAKVVSEVTGSGVRIVNPLASRSVTNSPEAVWSSGVRVTIGSYW